MKVAMIKGGRVAHVAVFPALDTARTFLEKGHFPGATEAVVCPYGYGIGDLYTNGAFEKNAGTAPAAAPETGEAPAPDTETAQSQEDDLLLMSVDHEYRITLLELEVM